MEDEILDYNWVISHEIPLKEDEGTLFQQYFNEDSLILSAAMLHDNNIEYHIEIENPENKNFGKSVHRIHINEDKLEKANELLGLLINEDEKYPIRKYLNTPLSSLETVLEENENVYVETLIKIELKRRGIELTTEEGGSNFLVSFIIFLSVVSIIILIFKAIEENIK